MVDDLNINHQQKQVNPRIQILRGVAVLLVIFFHLGLPQFSGGFLGVDAFLVISGFFMQLVRSTFTCRFRIQCEFETNRKIKILDLLFCIFIYLECG